MGQDVQDGAPFRAWPSRREFPVEYRYLDVLNHLNHAVYFGFMETLRCDYYLSLGGSVNPADLDIILAEASCQYLSPVRYGATLIGEVAPGLPIGRSSFSLLYRFHESVNQTPTARGRTVQVCYDYSTGQKKEITAARRAVLERDGVPLDWQEGGGGVPTAPTPTFRPRAPNSK
jgi:acyl-CoA thioester hydrolase